jgi:hypothetical protein
MWCCVDSPSLPRRITEIFRSINNQDHWTAFLLNMHSLFEQAKRVPLDDYPRVMASHLLGRGEFRGSATYLVEVEWDWMVSGVFFRTRQVRGAVLASQSGMSFNRDGPRREAARRSKATSEEGYSIVRCGNQMQ